MENGGKYVIQRINRYVFPSPQDIMENITGVTEFLREKILARGGDPLRETLNIRRTTQGGTLFVDEEGGPWRCMTFVDKATSHETVESPAMLREAGRAFGEFQSLLSGYPASTLHETIKDFHNTPERYRQLLEAAQNDKAGRLSQVGAEMDFAAQRKEDCALLMDLLREGKLPLRVTHNDTKMSNILIDDATGKAICVIDLDTVMPGLCAFDFGDSIRAGATTAAEDEADLSKVHFDLGLFEAYADGFLSAAGSALTPLELKTLRAQPGARPEPVQAGAGDGGKARRHGRRHCEIPVTPRRLPRRAASFFLRTPWEKYPLGENLSLAFCPGRCYGIGGKSFPFGRNVV